MAKKGGPFSAEEIAFVQANAKILTAAEIALQLGRNPKTVESYLSQVESLGGKADVLNLKKRQDWKIIQKQLSPEEIEVFEWHWNNIVKQFRDEIYHTEGMQVINAIKHEILANRMLSDQRKLNIQIEGLEAKLNDEYESGTPDLSRAQLLEKQIAALSAAQEANNKEYRENSKKFSELVSDLKATRNQRLNKADDMKKNFTELIKRLMDDPSIKRDVGSYIEKMRLAKYEELKRLAAPHKYENGEIDRPILNSETIYFEDEEQEGEKNED